MARERDISQADTGTPVRRASVQREIERRERNTAMGPGGSELRDITIVPTTKQAMDLAPLEVTRTFRYLDRMVRGGTDVRVELLQIILGE